MLKLVLGIVAVFMLAVNPVAAMSIGISPSSVEVVVPADGYGEAEFTVHGFDGEVGISLEGIPLVVEPVSINVDSTNNKIVVRIYGDKSLPSSTFDGKICFLGMLNGNVGAGVKVKATIHHEVGQSNGVIITTKVMNSGIGGGASGSLYSSDSLGVSTHNATAVNNDSGETGDIIPVVKGNVGQSNDPAIFIEDGDPWYNNVNWGLLMFSLICIALCGSGIYIWRKRRRKTKV